MSKNITLSVDDDLLEEVKVLAAKRRTSVSGLVRGYLGSLVAKERAIDEAREKLLKLAGEKAGDMGTKSWNREAVYDR